MLKIEKNYKLKIYKYAQQQALITLTERQLTPCNHDYLFVATENKNNRATTFRYAITEIEFMNNLIEFHSVYSICAGICSMAYKGQSKKIPNNSYHQQIFLSQLCNPKNRNYDKSNNRCSDDYSELPDISKDGCAANHHHRHPTYIILQDTE